MKRERLEWYYSNEKYFSIGTRNIVLQSLEGMEDEEFMIIEDLKFKDPGVALITALLFGFWGVDRFYLKSYALGLVKLCTFGGVFVLYVIDIVTAKKRTYTLNDKTILDIINPYLSNQVYVQNIQNQSNSAAAAANTVYKAADAYSRHIGDTDVTFRRY